MLLVIDIGNTNISIGLFKNNKLIGNGAIQTIKNRNLDDYAVDLVEFFLNKKINCLEINSAIIASVVPYLNKTIKDAIIKFTGDDTQVKIIGEDKVKLNINNRTSKPSEVGHDRLVNAIAAHTKYQNDLIVIDFGTAITFDVVNKDCEYLGGAIFPGINMSVKALHENTAKLPIVNFAKSKKVIGNNTSSAIISGIYNGFNAMTKGIITEIEKELNKQSIKVFTGGQASLFKDLIREVDGIYEPHLTLEGLNIIYLKNFNKIDESKFKTTSK